MADKDSKIPPVIAKNIIPVEIEDQMKSSYLAYAMSVIVGRALPDVRDGLKPVHRRILHAMNERGWRADKAYVKSAKIVGEVIGNYHPHGDVAVYDTMVRMVQDFAMRVPLIDGQGNFGSVDGDSAAAYRYTEARLTKMASELLKDIDKETVDFSPNFDDTKKEPRVLPASWPNLLVNGSSGIAVGMATKIPPHNLNEVIQAIEYLIQKPDCTSRELMKFIPAPDFPTGGIIIGKEGLKKAYTTGRGSIKIRAVTSIETNSRNRTCIIVTEIPYEIKKNELLAKMARLVTDKKIEGLADIRDESDRRGMRVVLELKKDTNEQVVLNQLFSRTSLEINYGIIFLALVNNEPKILQLKDMLKHYVEHRRVVVVKRTEYELREAEKKAHILEGLKIALDFIDEVIKIIRGSKDVESARNSLISRFKLTEIQANAILELRLQKLTSLESRKIIEELNELKATIKSLKTLLGSETKILELVKSELAEIREKFGKPRKSEISQQDVSDVSFDATDLIHNQDEVITLSEGGYIRRLPVDTFKRQHRGGKGVISGGKKEDNLKFAHFCRSLDTVLFFSNRGKVFHMKAYEITEAGKDARGKNIRGMLSLMNDEYITVIRSIEKFDDNNFLLLLTRQGIVKKMEVKSLQNAKKGGIMAMQFKNPDQEWLIDVVIVTDNDQVFLGSSQGNGLRTSLGKMRPQGRSASGIIGMNLDETDYMAGADVVKKDDDELIVITSKGYGKRVHYSEFAAKGRGGKGMAYLKISDQKGPVVAIKTVRPGQELIIITESGMTLRIGVNDIPVQGRTASGVRIVNLNEGDHIVDITVWSE
ncbi:MAG: DNA gyrase subunit A [Spirochaetia bacterium]|nr:DNA gyrase subunit A [Spirochaetia bacterium]